MSTLEGLDFEATDKANEEGMKKAAAKKAEKEEAVKEAKEKGWWEPCYTKVKVFNNKDKALKWSYQNER
jgi:hypothetical protein